MSIDAHQDKSAAPLRWWGWGLLCVAVLLCLLLGALNLSAPSLWHDELVHIFVGKSIAETGLPHLPSGTFYPSSLAYNYLLGAVIKVAGTGAFATRFPSALLAALNTLLLFLLSRKLFGNHCALLVAFLWALSPWNIAWARQARLYELQATAYLAFLLSAWIGLESAKKKEAAMAAAVALACFILGMLTSFHSLLALGSVGGYAILLSLYHKSLKNRYGVAIALCFLVGVLSLIALIYNPNRTDQAAVFQTGLGGRLLDPERIVRFYYLRWLKDNLSIGYMLLFFVGAGAMLWREGRKGLFAVLAFWTPLLILTFGIGYRRPRFIFFAFPIYCLLFSYGLYSVFYFIHAFFSEHEWPRWRKVLHGLGVFVLLLFLLRLGQSTLALSQDSLRCAQGARTTLARHHPQWKQPCAWLKEHAQDRVILSTTALPVLYYVGRVDEWFPNRYRPWEEQETGLKGLDSLEALQQYIHEHPSGFFIAEQWRFERWRNHAALQDTLGREVAWVRDHMQRIDEASSEDVTVYAWGDAREH